MIPSTPKAQVPLSPEEKRDLLRGIDYLLRNGRLHDLIQEAIAREDSRRWNIVIPAVHPFRRVYQVYADRIVQEIREKGVAHPDPVTRTSPLRQQMEEALEKANE